MKQVVDALPDFVGRQTPLTIGAVGLGAKVLGTPMGNPTTTSNTSYRR